MNPYKVLGVRPNASIEEIKEAYEALSNNYNTGILNDSDEEIFTEDKILEIDEAYTILNNNFKYKNIRGLIENKQFLSAESELSLISDKNSAEWNYLQGFVLLKKGWFQAGVNHLKTASQLEPNNEEYKQALLVLVKKIKEMKLNYAQKMQYNNSNNSNMCGNNNQSSNMCGSSGGIDPNILNMFMNMNTNNNMQNINPMDAMNAGSNPMQNILMQSLMGGNKMNMCNNSNNNGMC